MSTEQDRDREEWPSADSAALDETYSPFEDGEHGGGPVDDDRPHTGDDDSIELEARAMLAAEHALAAGQQALEAAQAAGASFAPRTRTRERVLRGLLAFNLLLMAVVLLLPDTRLQPGEGDRSDAGEEQRQPTDERAPPPVEPLAVPKTDDRYAQAMLRAAAGDLAGAVEDLEQYLAAEPRMPAAMKRNVLGALAHYSFKLGLEQRAQEFERRAAALTQSHFLPEDLVMMARRAEEEGDGDRMRRLYARFLLQQKQVPPSMHRFLAEAYLKLGDSYRLEAARSAERAEARRSRELQPVIPDRGREK